MNSLPARQRVGVARSWPLAAVVVLCLGGVATVLAQGGSLRYRDPVFQHVERAADIVYGRATDVPTGRPVDLHLDLYQPRADTEPARPVLLFIHGGGFVGGDKSAGQRWADEFARRGWVAVSIEYRLRQGDLATVGIPAAVSDARQAMRWLRREAASYRLDTTRIVVGGSSAGGITALFLAYTELERGSADADSAVAGVMDLWGALYGQEEAMAAGEPPLVIVHGTEDTVVPFRYAEALRDRAAAVGIPHAFHPLEGVGHGSGETAQISAWTAAFLYPLLWPSDLTPTARPTATHTASAAASPTVTALAEPSPSATAPTVPSATPSSSPSAHRACLPVLLNSGTFAARSAPATPAPSESPTPATASPTAPTDPGTVLTRSGAVGGTAVGAAWRFLGIPYAAAPVGSLRWRAPAPAPTWSAPRAADAFGPACPQYGDDGAVFGSEDCLTLNVWTPRDAPVDGRARPVLFFIHGGGHEQGSSDVLAGDSPVYDGRVLAAEHDTVVVTINYRLGPFGFLAHPALTLEGGAAASGNYGSLDQLAALLWVRDNIAAFGGDPGKVTVFGQSAGSVSACRLVASPLAAGLLRRAVLMSGACVATPLARAEASGVAVAAELGCGDASDVPTCLRGRTTVEVMATLDPMDDGTDSLARMSYDGVIDGYLLPEAPRALIAARGHNAVPVIVGTTSAENGRNAPRIATTEDYEAAVRDYVRRSALPAGVADRVLQQYPASDYPAPRDAYVALTSDVKFVCQARMDARAFAAAQAAPVYRYWFDHVPDNGGAQARAFGAFHGIELLYLFGVLDVGLEALRYRPGPGDRAVAAAMQGYWARFAAAGDPSAGEAVNWPPFTRDTEAYLALGAPIATGTALRAAQCDFWDSLAGR